MPRMDAFHTFLLTLATPSKEPGKKFLSIFPLQTSRDNESSMRPTPELGDYSFVFPSEIGVNLSASSFLQHDLNSRSKHWGTRPSAPSSKIPEHLGKNLSLGLLLRWRYRDDALAGYLKAKERKSHHIQTREVLECG